LRAWRLPLTRLVTVTRRGRSRADATEGIIVDLRDAVPVIDQVIGPVDVRAALAGLSPDCRQVVTEMYLHGHSVAETARILGIPDGAVKSRSYQALRVLRRTVPCPAGPPSLAVSERCRFC
jgi:RNA polymerase sigma-70 factor, ECF subfamily